MLSLVLRVINRIRPREGWVPFLLVVAALLSPAGALILINDGLDAAGLLTMTSLAILFGLRLARSRFSAPQAAILGSVVGVSGTALVVGRLLPSLSLLWTEGLYSLRWLDLWRQGTVLHPLPFATSAGFLWQRLSELGERLWWWVQTASGGGPARDPIAFVLLVTFVAWGLGLLATWQIYRNREALLGLLPGGLAMTIIAFFGGGLTVFYLITYLFCTLWLVAITDLWKRQDRWQRIGTDYPGELGLELVFALTPVLLAVLLLAAFFPVLQARQLRDAFWELMDGPWATVESASERFFGPIDRGGDVEGSAGGGLPRAHLLGGGPDLDETIIFYVTTNDPAPPRDDADLPGTAEFQTPRRYWRATTYDTYTGRGWANGPLELRTIPAGQPLNPSLPLGFDLVQYVERLEPGGESLFAANAPWQTDHGLQTWWRGPDDLAEASSTASEYTVISRPPAPTLQELRDAPPLIPPNVAARYLALPEEIPERVLDLAREVVGEADTRYDQARAIETYLRAYTYTLDLPPPPANRDLVDYFLFEQQEGYCDYYASAMVVMARAVGIPARLASGYAQGTYDHDRERWVVTGKDGHSWTEVYFDGPGWIEFEPTAGLPALDRPGGQIESARPAVPPLPPRPQRWWQRIPWLLLGMAGVLILALATIVWIWLPGRRRDLVATDLVRDRQARLQRWGERLGHPLRDGRTAREYGAELTDALRERGQLAQRFQVRQASHQVPADIKELTDAFIRAQYAPEPITDREGWRIRDLWPRLRRRLWWLWLGKG